MVTLDPEGSFEDHLETLLRTVQDDGLRKLLKANASLIGSLVEESKPANRATIVEQLESLVEKRLGEADGED